MMKRTKSRLFAGPVTRPARKAQRRIRQAVAEALESRRLLTAFTVMNNLDDGSVGSLRWAIGQANSHSGSDQINFDPGFFGTSQTITLTGGQLALTDTAGTEMIMGPAAGVTISGNKASRVFEVNASVTATISGVTLSAGLSDKGAGMVNYGATTLTDCVVSGNAATVTAFANVGGGVYNAGTLTMTGCTVSGNSVALRSITEGGGVYNAGALMMDHCTVSGNSAPFGEGGGVINESNQIRTLEGGPAATMTLTDCTVSGNSSGNGGGLVSNYGNVGHGSATLTNCTVAGNTASVAYPGISSGGGILNSFGPMTLINCTVSGNSCDNASSGGVSGGGSTTLQNTIIARNFDVFVSPLHSFTQPGDVGGAFNSLGNNLIGLPDGGSGWIASDLIGADPRLAPLGNYGGPTPTMDLLPGSAAINAGASGMGIPTTDQRGLGRIGATDIGAAENQGFTLATVAGSTPQSAYAGFAFGTPLGATLTENATNSPLPGVTISFAVPANGPGLTKTTTQAVTTDATGVASLPVAANALGGDFVVTATATLVATSASFNLHNIPLVSIAVTPPNPSIYYGLTQQFTATGTYADASTFDLTSNSFLTWASATPSVAKINARGLASPAGGEIFTSQSSVITASMGGVTSPGDTLTINPVPVTSYTVTNANDSGSGSLRDAITQADSTSSLATITFDPSFFGTVTRTITLTTGTLNLTSLNLTDVVGPGADMLTVTGSTTSLFFNVASGASVSLSGMTISGGKGGGVKNGGTLTMTGCDVGDNQSLIGASYGVNNSGMMTMTDCTVSGNDVKFSFNSPAVWGVINSGTLEMTGCTVSDNGDKNSTGGGVENTNTPQ